MTAVPHIFGIMLAFPKCKIAINQNNLPAHSSEIDPNKAPNNWLVQLCLEKKHVILENDMTHKG